MISYGRGKEKNEKGKKKRNEKKKEKKLGQL